jgi:outer membrane protein OmpA-like peptidoglycan-associated protein
MIIEAHTDSIGSLEYNKKLSDRRANSAYSFLNSLEIEADSISIVGHGELHPAMSNKSETGRSKNRRVDIGFFTNKKLGILSGFVVNDSTGMPIPATIILRSKSYRDSVSVDESGKFNLTTPLNEVVVIEATAKDHFFVNKVVKITPGVLKSGIQLEMPRVEAGKKFELENFYFVGNKPVLLPRSVPVLHRLLEFMKLNPEICIRIDGHINLTNQGPASKNSWHWKLSDDRTKTVYNFLVKNGVDERRMKRKAFANWEMVYPNARDERLMKKNRRVELMIIDCASE